LKRQRAEIIKKNPSDDKSEDAWDKLYTEELTLTDEQHEKGKYGKVSDYSIQKWNGKEFETMIESL